MKYLIVGLGNIGEKYKNTRHNIGFMVLDKLAENHNIPFSTQKYASIALLKEIGKSIYLVKPTTYMNNSGLSVKYWKQTLSISLENILIIVDDIALPLGTLRVKSQGSSAGHNGLRDIENAIATNKYSRLRIGIGNNFSKGNQAEYVLSNFNQNELEKVQGNIALASDIIKKFYIDGINITMNTYNKSH